MHGEAEEVMKQHLRTAWHCGAQNDQDCIVGKVSERDHDDTFPVGRRVLKAVPRRQLAAAKQPGSNRACVERVGCADDAGSKVDAVGRRQASRRDDVQSDKEERRPAGCRESESARQGRRDHACDLCTHHFSSGRPRFDETLQDPQRCGMTLL